MASIAKSMANIVKSMANIAKSMASIAKSIAISTSKLYGNCFQLASFPGVPKY